MPVDLSRVGLEGIETAQRTMNSIAAREAQASQTAIAEAEEARTAEDRAIDQWAAGALDSIAKGDGIPGGGEVSLGASSDDPSAVFDAIGERYFRAGAPKRAKEFIVAGADLRKKIADTDKVKDDQEKVRLDNMVEAGGWVAQNIGENESEYAVFLSQLEDPDNPIADIIGRDQVAILKNTPWSPELVNYFRTKALSIKDQASLALVERGHRRMERAAEFSQQNAAARLRIAEERLRIAKEAEARAAKVGGPDAGKAPNTDQRKTAQRAIVNNVKALNGTMPAADTPEYEAVLAMTEDVAGRAQIIVRDNKGVTFPEAVTQAVAEAELAGDFRILAVETDPWGPAYVPERKGYKPRGKTPDKPIPLPQGKPADVRKRLVKGRFYQTPMGTLKWNGSSFDQ